MASLVFPEGDSDCGIAYLKYPGDIAYLKYPGYKIEQLTRVTVFIRENLTLRRPANFEGRGLSTTWLCVDSGDHVRVYACLYRFNIGYAETHRLMERMQLAIDDILSKIPSAEIVTWRFKCAVGLDHAPLTTWGWLYSILLWRMDYPKWLRYLRDSVTWPTTMPLYYLLDLLLTSHPEQFQVVVNAPLGSLDHCLLQNVVRIS